MNLSELGRYTTAELYQTILFKLKPYYLKRLPHTAGTLLFCASLMY